MASVSFPTDAQNVKKVASINVHHLPNFLDTLMFSKRLHGEK